MPLPTKLRIELEPTGTASKVIDAHTGVPLEHVRSFSCGGHADGLTWIEIEISRPTVVIDGETRVIYKMDEDDLRRVAGDMGFKLVLA